MAESTLSVTRADIVRHIARQQFWDSASVDSEQLANLNDIIKSGLRNFYLPPILPGERVQHNWSFLRPVWHMQLVGDKGDYDLPDDFGGFVSDLYYSDYVIDAPLKETGIGILLGYRSTSTSSVPLAAQPTQFAVHAQPTEGTTPQRLTISFYPIPDQSYELIGQYEINPYNLAADAAYPMGGQPHAETLIESCLAAAERMMDDQIGLHNAQFMQRLQASIYYDRKHSGGKIGRTMSDGRGKPKPIRRTQFVLYNGLRYDD